MSMSMVSDDFEHIEGYYFALDLGPILAVWALGILLVIFLVVIPFLTHYCCRCEHHSRHQYSCKRCRCQNCGRLKCGDNSSLCECSQCMEDGEPRDFRHQMPSCEYCSQNPKPFRTDEIITCTDCCVKCYCPCFKWIAECLCDFWGLICRKSFRRKRSSAKTISSRYHNHSLKLFDGNHLLIAGNSLTRLFFGGTVGPLRETKKIPNIDCSGREVSYINDLPLLERAFLLHLALTLTSILLTIFCLSTFLDILLVSSDSSCDPGEHCYILDNVYIDDPLPNCSVAMSHENSTVVCYKFVFDYRKAAGYAGGLYTVSRLSVTIVANVCILLYKRVKGNKCLLTFCVLLQYVLGATIIVLCLLAEYNFIYVLGTPAGPPLSQLSTWLDTLCVVFTINLSFVTPWHLAVEPVGTNFACCVCSRRSTEERLDWREPKSADEPMLADNNELIIH